MGRYIHNHDHHANDGHRQRLSVSDSVSSVHDLQRGPKLNYPDQSDYVFALMVFMLGLFAFTVLAGY